MQQGNLSLLPLGREPGRSGENVPVSLVPRNVGSDPELKIDGNRLVSVYPFLFYLTFLRYAFFCVFRSTLQGYNRSIIDLSPLSETT
jgi:hypothetical protein